MFNKTIPTRQGLPVSIQIKVRTIQDVIPTTHVTIKRMLLPHGARVSTLAAGHLEAVGVQVDHLTLLDSPEDFGSLAIGGKNSLQSELSRLDIGTNTGQIFVDNYHSSYGEPYSGVLNVAYHLAATE